MNGCYRQQQRRRWWRRRSLLVGVALAALFFLLVNWWMLSLLEEFSFHQKATASGLFSIRSLNQLGKGRRHHGVLHTGLLSLAAHALAEGDGKIEPQELWRERSSPTTLWTPCSYKHLRETSEGENGYILVSANGGISQQRIAICNAVAVARLLNATLVIPNFLFSSVWSDPSQFSDIYQEDFFVDYLRTDIRIVKELPLELRSLDLEAIGSLVTDTDIVKESKPSFFLKNVLPILIKNRVVHFVGFGNRLAFDPIPFNLQRLRCKCNFHALRFVRKIQETGALLVRRMRNHTSLSRPLDENLVGPFASELAPKGHGRPQDSRYLAVHLRFEIDMAAYSMCYFGGGKEEEQELEAYRLSHFPALTHLKNTTRSATFRAQLRSEGQCPLTPEEAVLVLAALGFKRRTRIYVAGANIYGGRSMMVGLNSLYPNLVTKESLLSSSEMEPFLNLSSQVTNSLVSGYRMYYGSGMLPTIRPNKRRLASVFSRHSTIEWSLFERSIRKAFMQMKRTVERPIARSIYRHPRCAECMCRSG
ncbi:unnamed protein product [Spirodela intermedia]|uniref:O-fucosyltransferase family protein n=1 Tax=Spirodela intermedia TaxID=51605 RepID=A0A7I8JKB7_SPIIN|nr:unnamed protein product [Spirodela intermedia]CAA6670588.1 unnamed protein product [Spirodela intermedia]